MVDKRSRCLEDNLPLFPIVIAVKGDDERFQVLNLSYCAYCRKYVGPNGMGTLEEVTSMYLKRGTQEK
jgi:hypothetical protein